MDRRPPTTTRAAGRHRHRRPLGISHHSIEPGPEHSHGHSHGPVSPSSGRVRRLLVLLVVPCALATLVGVVLTFPAERPTADADVGFGQWPVRGQVTAVDASSCTDGTSPAGSPTAPGCTALTVRLQEGPAAGREIVQVQPNEPSQPRFQVGDRIVLRFSGGNPADELSYQVVDFQRGPPLLWLAALFAVAVLLLGRWQGLRSLVALGMSFAVLLGYVLPAILAGSDPLTVGVLGSGVIMFAVLYLTHGFSARTSVAVLGTLVSLALIGLLGAGFSAAAELTGLDEDTTNLIGILGTGVDSRGLLLAGVVIGALGVLDDMTVTQTSAVWELRRADPGLRWRELYSAALRIGRDHVSSAVNTLAMAYAGAALPVLLAFSLSGQSFATIVTAQDVAQEVVRTLVGSIGLVAAVPITTALAAAVARQERAPR